MGPTPAPISTRCAMPATRVISWENRYGTVLLPLERAVQLITDMPARLFGLDGRGRIARKGVGPISLRSTPPPSARTPSACGRIFPEVPPGCSAWNAVGVRHVLVNGVEIVDGDQITGALPWNGSSGQAIKSRPVTAR